MTGLPNYIFSVTAAAIVVAVLRPLMDGKGASGAIGKMVGGIFLLFTLLQPITQFRLNSWEDITGALESDAAYAVAQGEAEAKKELQGIITSRVQAYILEKANQYDATLQVQVTLSEDPIPVPIGVTITGSISPYGKKQMQKIIESDLGVAKEDQIWK